MTSTVLLKTILLVSLVLQIQATQCPNFDQFESKCKCVKNPEFGSLASLDCDQVQSPDLFKIFGSLNNNGDGFYELILRNSNIAELDELPEYLHYNLQFLKLYHVTGLSPAKLKSIIAPLDNLDHLTVEGGDLALTTVDRDLFGHKQKLHTINLNHVKISKVNDDAFDHLSNLKILSLDGNLLKAIPSNVFLIRQLTDLHLYGNLINKVSDEETSALDDKNINVYLNSIDCSCEVKDTKFVKWVREKKLNTVSCSSPEEVQEKEIRSLTEEDICSKGTVLFSSLVLIVGLLFAPL